MRDGRLLRFDLETSHDCEGGTNDREQGGTAIATFEVPAYNLISFDFGGMAELEDSNYERLSFYVNDDLYARTGPTPTENGPICASGPIEISWVTTSPQNLRNGTNTIRVEFTTGDGFSHIDSFYEVYIAFQQITIRPNAE